MSRYRCLSCGGRYDSEEADGSLYFHACPPLAVDSTGKVIERPDRRDENAVKQVDGGEPRLKLEGRGRELVTVDEAAPAPPEAPRGLWARAKARLFPQRSKEAKRV
jgi:hypothetical protein